MTNLTAQNIEDLQSRIEALVRCNPETGAEWADICAMEAVVVDWQDGTLEGSPQWIEDNSQLGVGA